MKIPGFFILGAIVALIMFIYMRNRQAARNDKRRERLHEQQEKLLKMLSKKQTENETNKTE